MALTADTAKLPDDPVLLLAMVIDKIRCGQLRVGRFDLMQRASERDRLELVMQLEPLMRYDGRRDPIAFVTDDGPNGTTENRTVQVSVGDIINDIREFREWRDMRDRTRGVAGPPPMTDEGLRSASLAKLTAAFKAGTISMQTFRECVLRCNKTGSMTIEDARMVQSTLEPPLESPSPSFDAAMDAADEWIASDSKDPRDIGTPRGRRARPAKVVVPPPEPPAIAPTRDLIFDD